MVNLAAIRFTRIEFNFRFDINIILLVLKCKTLNDGNYSTHNNHDFNFDVLQVTTEFQLAYFGGW